MVLYLLYDSAVGFALFQLIEFDESSAQLVQVQKQIEDMSIFGNICRLKAFQPFNAASALDSAIHVGQGELTDDLKNFLETNIPQSKKKGKVILALLDPKLAQNISEQLKFECKINDVILELFRGIRLHFTKFLKDEGLKEEDLTKAQLGLAHSFSRNKIALDINRQDKPIIQSIAVLDLLDKDLNTMSMRIKEWYSWNFPELAKIVTDNEIYVRLVQYIKNKNNLGDQNLEEVEEIAKDATIAQQIIDAAKSSMGQDFSDLDQQCLGDLCKRVINQFEYKKEMQQYLQDRMMSVAPNLTTLIGENVGGKLISHAGGLSNLIKYPASTVQILGAEKALFRALKTKGNTPKYGLLYHSSYIGKASGKDKGKVSRYLANKCSMAARLDYFLINPTNRFGEKLKSQVDERLKFLTQGGKTTKNIDAMDEILNQLKEENLYFEQEQKVKPKKSKKNKKKRSRQIQEEEEQVQEIQEDNQEQELEQIQVEKKKKKKTKKSE